jgi:hypothetical protein
MRLTVIVLVLISLSLAFHQEQVAPTKADLASSPLVKIGELFAHPEQYDGLIIRVNDVWVNGYHGAVVCTIDDENQCVGVRLECADGQRCKEIDKVLKQNLKPGPSGEFWDMRGRLSVIGRFRDTKAKGQNSPRFFLEVLNVEAVSPQTSG